MLQDNNLRQEIIHKIELLPLEKLKEVNYNLTDEDLTYQPGNAGPLLERLAKKMDRTPDEVRKWIESVSSNKGKLRDCYLLLQLSY